MNTPHNFDDPAYYVKRNNTKARTLKWINQWRQEDTKPVQTKYTPEELDRIEERGE